MSDRTKQTYEAHGDCPDCGKEHDPHECQHPSTEFAEMTPMARNIADIILTEIQRASTVDAGIKHAGMTIDKMLNKSVQNLFNK